MHGALLDRCLEALGAVRKHIAFSANLRNQASDAFGCKAEGAPCFDIEHLLGEAADPTNWRVIDHCAAVTRSYALFESFVLELLREYIVFLSGGYTLTALGADFRSKYTRGLGQILVDQEKQRFRGLDMAAMIRAASDALSDKEGYELQPEALLRAEQNFRMQELQRLFAQCGLRDVENWVTNHPAIKLFFAEEGRLSQTAASELKQIVDYRNEAAHGDVDDVLGPDVLVEFAKFFEALCRCLTDLVQYDTLRRAKQIGRAKTLGVVCHRYSGGVVIVRSTNANVAVGDRLYILGKGETAVVSVDGIQLDGVNLDKVAVTTEVELGLKIGARPKIGCELLAFS